MRISTAYEYQVYAQNIDSAEQKVFSAQQQETTGLAINSASDNPAGAQEMLNMETITDSLNQFEANLSNAKGILTTTDSALTSINTMMQSASSLALQASSTTSQAQMSNLATQVQTLMQQLVAAGNTQGPNGEYLFAGQQTSTPPFSVSNGTLTYAGDGNSIQVAGGPNEQITVNVPGSPLFTNAYSALQGLENDLQSGNITAISNTDVANLASSQTAFSQAQGSLGSQADQVATLTTYNTQRVEELTSDVSNIRDVNTAQAVTNYQAAENAYQAALSVVGQASNLSLVSYLQSNLS